MDLVTRGDEVVGDRAAHATESDHGDAFVAHDALSRCVAMAVSLTR